MGTVTVVGEPLPNIPWQDQPSGHPHPVWRYFANPIIKRDAIPIANSIFNSAVVRFEGRFAGVFRVDHRSREMRLHAGFSDDALSWTIEPEPIQFTGKVAAELPFEYGYDPRVVRLDDSWYISWCNGCAGFPTIGLAKTRDFVTFEQMENALLPFNRNGVLFPRKIGGRYAMLSRPSDNGHTPFGDIFYSESPDLCWWGRHRHVFGTAGGWQSTKVGAGPVPIETSEGWLLLYHGVLTSCNGFVYSFGAALLDLDQPWQVIRRSRSYLLNPREQYECVGDVPNVVFPCAALCDGPTGRLAIYYGAADTVTCLAFGLVHEIVDWLVRDGSSS